MLYLIIPFINLFFNVVDTDIHEMSLSEVYSKADDMTSFDFDLNTYSDSVKSEGFDFISLEPVNNKGFGYFQSYYGDSGLKKVVKYSAKNIKEYVLFIDSRNEGYSFLWMFFYGKRQLMSNGFFINTEGKELYFIGLSEPMGSLLEILDSEGKVQIFDFGEIYTLPEENVSSVVGQIASVDKNLSPSSILHCRSGKPFGIESLEDSTLNIFSFTEFDCEENLSKLNEISLFKVDLILNNDVCYSGQLFHLRNQSNNFKEYYTKRTF